MGSKYVAVQERNDRICSSEKSGYLSGQHLAQHLSPCEAQGSAAPGTSSGASCARCTDCHVLLLSCFHKACIEPASKRLFSHLAGQIRQ